MLYLKQFSELPLTITHMQGSKLQQNRDKLTKHQVLSYGLRLSCMDSKMTAQVGDLYSFSPCKNETMDYGMLLMHCIPVIAAAFEQSQKEQNI